MSNKKNPDKLEKCLKKKKTWFTLVELIVVITIIAILWTIAFISFQNYTKNARDGVRISDINSLKKNLELFITEKWFYPAPDNGTNITYIWATAWTQWTVWDNVMTNLARISNKPTDPLTGNEYTYSLANNKVEYQLWAMLEWGWNLTYSPILNQTNAASEKKATALITWTYNEKILKVSTGWTDYLLAVPSIINATLHDPDLPSIIANQELVYNNYSNLPSSYEDKWYTMTGWFDFVPWWDIVVYSGSMETLWSSWTIQQQFIENLQSVYIDTIVSSTPIIQEIINATTPEQQQILAWSYIDNHVWGITGENTATIQCDLQYIAPSCNTWFVYDNTLKQCVKYDIIALQNPTQCKVYAEVSSVLVWWSQNYNLVTTPWATITQSYPVQYSRPPGRIYKTFSVSFDNTCKITYYTKTHWNNSSDSWTPNILPWNSLYNDFLYDRLTNNSTYSCPDWYTIDSWGCKNDTPTLEAVTCSNWTFDSSIDQCKYNPCGTTPVIPSSTSPTNLSLTHSTRTKSFTFSWTAWTNNWWSCKLQYYKNWTTWTDISATTYNCDTTLSNQSITLPWDWWNGAWSSIPVRVIRTSDSVALWTFAQNLTCSTIAWSATSTPSIDEDCNWSWDNVTGAWDWVLEGTNNTYYYYGWWYVGVSLDTCKTYWFTYMSYINQSGYGYVCYGNTTWQTSGYVSISAQQYIKSTWSYY